MIVASLYREFLELKNKLTSTVKAKLKKEQKKLNAEKRKTWGDLKPITKVKPSAKLYNRKKKQDLTSYSKLNPVFVFNANT